MSLKVNCLTVFFFLFVFKRNRNRNSEVSEKGHECCLGSLHTRFETQPLCRTRASRDQVSLRSRTQPQPDARWSPQNDRDVLETWVRHNHDEQTTLGGMAHLNKLCVLEHLCVSCRWLTHLSGRDSRSVWKRTETKGRAFTARMLQA